MKEDTTSSGHDDNSIYKLAEDEFASTLALDWVKQVITLASGLLAISATFVVRIEERVFSSFLIVLLGISWVSLIISVFSGLEFIKFIVNYRVTQNEKYHWAEFNKTGNNLAWVCKSAFLAGLVLFAAFGLIAVITSQSSSLSTSTPVPTITIPAPTLTDTPMYVPTPSTPSP